MPQHCPKPTSLSCSLSRSNGFGEGKIAVRIDVHLLDRIKLEQDGLFAIPAHRQSGFADPFRTI